MKLQSAVCEQLYLISWSSARMCVSSMQHIEQMKATAMMKPRELHKLGDEFVSIYLNQQSFQCAQLAAGSCLNALDQILCGQVRREWLCSVIKAS